MKPKFSGRGRGLFGNVVASISIIVTVTSAPAATIYWDGPSAAWDAVTSWSTVANATTPDPAAVPGAGDDVVFNVDGANSASVVNLNAAQAVSGLSFNSTGSVLLQGGGANRALTIGGGGISVAATAGAATIGSGSANQNVAVTLGATQTWTNLSATPLTLANPFTSAAGVNLTKTGPGAVFMSNTANTSAISGLLDIQAGKLQTAGDLNLNGGLAGTNAGALENAGGASKWIYINSPTDSNFGGTIQGNPSNPGGARLGVVKRGLGALTFTGDNTMADNLAVENGTLRLTGVNNVGYDNGGMVSVGNIANQSGILLVEGGTLNANRTGSPSLAIGNGANARGFLKMSSGAIKTVNQFNVGNGGAGSFSAFSMSGGTLTSGNWIVVGANNDRAIFNQSGGTVIETAARMTIGAGGNGSVGVANLSGGTLTINAGANTGIFLGENGVGTLNLSGTAAVNLPTNGGGTSGTFVFGNNASSLAATLNLNGGSLTTKEFVKGASTAGAVYRINFNGGTVKPNANNDNFLNNLSNTTGYVNPGGAVFDTNNFNITVGMPLLAPTGSGVSAIAVGNGGAGYLDAPMVTLSGGSGTGAQAVATVTNGVITGYIITNPGVDYAPGDVVTVTLFGGGATTAAVPGAVSLAPNVSGGVLKSGSGSLTLFGTSTYTGATTVTAGSLVTGAVADINSSSEVVVNGPSARFVHNSGLELNTPVKVTQGTLDGTGMIGSVAVANSASNVLTHGDGTGALLMIGELTFNDAATIDLDVTSFSSVIDANTLNTGAVGGGKISINANSPSWAPGVYDLITYSTLTGGGFGEFERGTISGLGARQAAVLGNPAGRITLTISGDNPVWTGRLNGNWTTNVLSAPKNWALVSSNAPTDYVQGDIVLFDDSAIGTTSVVISDADVSPLIVNFNSFGPDYSVSSPNGFGIASGTVNLNGTSAVALNTANSYAGGTNLNFGTLQINHPSAIGTGPLTITGTLGLLDNTSGAPITLTTANPQFWNGDFGFIGTHDLNLGSGPVTLGGTRALTIEAGSTLGVAGAIGGAAGLGLTKLGEGTLALSGNNTYNGITSIRAGKLAVTAGVTGNISTVVEISPDQSGVGKVEISGGVLNSNRLILAGNNGNNGSPGPATLIQTGGVINCSQWFTVGSGVNGVNTGVAGEFHMSGGVVNTSTVGTQNFEVGNFTSTTGVVNMSGSSAINVFNNATVALGANPGSAGGIFNQNGGVVTLFSNAGTTVGGTGSLRLGAAADLPATASFTYNLNGGSVVVPAVTRNGAATNLSSGNLNFNGGTLKATNATATFVQGLTAATILNGGAVVDDSGFAITIAQPLLSGGAGDGGLTKTGAGTLALTGASSYVGPTTVAAGTLLMSGAGSINTSSGVIVNGAGAKFSQASSVAVGVPVTVTNGTVDGVGSIASITLANGAGNVLTHGNGGNGVLATGSLTFADAATVNLKVGSPTPVITTGTLNSGTAGAGKVTINVTNSSWMNGQVYNLISYTTLAGGGFGEFQKGTIGGLTTRQVATLTNPAGQLALSIVGDNPVWTGALNNNWSAAVQAAPKNWKLATAGTATDFVALDTVLFNDSATGSTDVVLAENLVTTSAIFANENKAYSLSSPGGFGITGGLIAVNGPGSVAIQNANTYAGGTLLNAGVLNLNHPSAIGTGPLTVSGGTLGSTGAADVALVTNNPLAWNGDFVFNGPRNLSLGTGAVTLGGTGTTRSVAVNSGKLTIGGIPTAAGFGIVKTGGGALALNGTAASAIGGSLNVAAGTFEIGGQNFTATGLAGPGTIINGSAIGSSLIINNATVQSFPGALQNGTGAGLLGFTKQGVGTLTLTGTHAVGNEFRVEGGVVEIAAGSLNAAKPTVPSIAIGPVASAQGVLRVTGGAVSTAHEIRIGNGNGAAGTNPWAVMTVSGGTVTSGNWLVVAANNDRAILNQTGGNINVTTNRMTIAAGGNGAIGVANFSGGVFTNNTGIFLGENGNGTLNISGNAALTMGNMQFAGNATSVAGALNLLGGSLATGSITKGTGSGVYTFNFNGGTLRATAANAGFFASLANTNAYIYQGGAVINDGGFSITIAQPLLAPAGSGVSAIALANGGAGYLDTPLVTLSGGNGAGASAVAHVSNGVVTGFSITNPGTGYAPGDVLTATLFGGGATTPATVGAVSLSTNFGGGLTKEGSGVLTLDGQNTYAGNTVVAGGSLVVTRLDALPDGGDVRLSSTATLNLTFTGTDKVDEFFINNVKQAAGEWGAVGSGAANTSPQITGPGRILVSAGTGDPYATWAAGFPGFANSAPGVDSDHDGFSNLLEFVLGGNPTVSSTAIAPIQSLNPTSLVFTFKRSDESESPTTTQRVETSTNLSDWTTSVLPPIVIGATNSSGAGYTVTIAENGAAADDVTVTINRGAHTRVFARLRADKP
jgi:autotransporter-associated beta strand protein